jgi:Antibiotic biosynthesis monooxygenase
MLGRIVRVWKGYGAPDGVRRYCDEHFTHAVLPRLRAIDGFVNATVLVRSLEEETEVVVVTTWESIEAVRAFAGEEYEVAVVEPIVADLLTRFDARVSHFQITVAT